MGKSPVCLSGNLKTHSVSNKRTLLLWILQAPLMNRILPTPSMLSIPSSSKEKSTQSSDTFIKGRSWNQECKTSSLTLRHCERCFTFACCNLPSTNMFIHILQNWYTYWDWKEWGILHESSIQLYQVKLFSQIIKYFQYFIYTILAWY